MLIKREVYFSDIDDYGYERLYSTNEVMSEDEYLDEVMFSDIEDDDYYYYY